SDAKVLGHALSTRQAERESTAQVPGRQYSHHANEPRQTLQTSREHAVDLACLVVDGDRNAGIEKGVEVHDPVREHRQVGIAVERKYLAECRAGLSEAEPIESAHHAVSERVCSHREFD